MECQDEKKLYHATFNLDVEIWAHQQAAAETEAESRIAELEFDTGAQVKFTGCKLDWLETPPRVTLQLSDSESVILDADNNNEWWAISDAEGWWCNGTVAARLTCEIPEWFQRKNGSKISLEELGKRVWKGRGTAAVTAVTEIKKYARAYGLVSSEGFPDRYIRHQWIKILTAKDRTAYIITDEPGQGKDSRLAPIIAVDKSGDVIAVVLPLLP